MRLVSSINDQGVTQVVRLGSSNNTKPFSHTPEWLINCETQGIIRNAYGTNDWFFRIADSKKLVEICKGDILIFDKITHSVSLKKDE